DETEACISYTPNSGYIGEDETCVVVCDENGICDTTIVIITVLPPPDTVHVTTPMDSTVTVCLDTTMLSGPITSISSCEDPMNGTVSYRSEERRVGYTPSSGYIQEDETNDGVGGEHRNYDPKNGTT